MTVTQASVDRVVERARLDFEGLHLARLIRYMRQRSVAATGEGIDAMCQLLVDDMRDLGGEARIVLGPELPVVIAHFDAGAALTLLVHTMYDVVPADEPEWVVEPFSATRMPWHGMADCLVGRGAEDTKSSIAMIYAVIAAHKAAGVPLPINLILVQEASELGSGSLPTVVSENKTELQQADVVWWPFITGQSDGSGAVYLGAKGLITGKLRSVAGDWGGPAGGDIVGVHSNWIANPAIRLAQALASMRTADDTDVTIDGFYDGLAPPTPQELALIDRLVDQFKPDDLLTDLGARRFKQDSTRQAIYDYCFKSNFNVAGLRAGAVLDDGYNVVIPREAVAAIDIRPIGQTVETVNQSINRHLASKFPGVSWEPHNGYRGARVPIDNWAVEGLLSVYSDMAIDVQVWPTISSAIAVSLWTEVVGRPWIMSMPGHAAGKHSPNEYIVVDGFRQALEFGIRLVWRLASVASKAPGG